MPRLTETPVSPGGPGPLQRAVEVSPQEIVPVVSRSPLSDLRDILFGSADVLQAGASLVNQRRTQADRLDAQDAREDAALRRIDADAAAQEARDRAYRDRVDRQRRQAESDAIKANQQELDKILIPMVGAATRSGDWAPVVTRIDDILQGDIDPDTRNDLMERREQALTNQSREEERLIDASRNANRAIAATFFEEAEATYLDPAFIEEISRIPSEQRWGSIRGMILDEMGDVVGDRLDTGNLPPQIRTELARLVNRVNQKAIDVAAARDSAVREGLRNDAVDGGAIGVLNGEQPLPAFEAFYRQEFPSATMAETHVALAERAVEALRSAAVSHGRVGGEAGYLEIQTDIAKAYTLREQLDPQAQNILDAQIRAMYSQAGITGAQAMNEFANGFPGGRQAMFALRDIDGTKTSHADIAYIELARAAGIDIPEDQTDFLSAIPGITSDLDQELISGLERQFRADMARAKLSPDREVTANTERLAYTAGNLTTNEDAARGYNSAPFRYLPVAATAEEFNQTLMDTLNEINPSLMTADQKDLIAMSLINEYEQGGGFNSDSPAARQLALVVGMQEGLHLMTSQNIPVDAVGRDLSSLLRTGSESGLRYIGGVLSAIPVDSPQMDLILNGRSDWDPEDIYAARALQRAMAGGTALSPQTNLRAVVDAARAEVQGMALFLTVQEGNRSVPLIHAKPFRKQLTSVAEDRYGIGLAFDTQGRPLPAKGALPRDAINVLNLYTAGLHAQDPERPVDENISKAFDMMEMDGLRLVQNSVGGVTMVHDPWGHVPRYNPESRMGQGEYHTKVFAKFLDNTGSVDILEAKLGFRGETGRAVLAEALRRQNADTDRAFVLPQGEEVDFFVDWRESQRTLGDIDGGGVVKVRYTNKLGETFTQAIYTDGVARTRPLTVSAHDFAELGSRWSVVHTERDRSFSNFSSQEHFAP